MPTNETVSPRVREAQRRIVSIATWILLLEQRLFEIQQSLPLAAAHLAMEEESIPYSTAGAIYVTLGQVQTQHMRRAAQKLLKASKQNDQDLALDFHDLGIESASPYDFGPETDDHE